MQTVSAFLTWSHYVELLSFSDVNKINFYIQISINQYLSVRDLRKRIKSNEYERLPLETKNKTIGIIICKNNNEFIIEYCSDKRIITREYELI